MTYAAREASVHDGNAVFLLECAIGAQTWRYTPRGEDVLALSQTWTAASIGIGGIEQTNELNKASLQIEFDRANPFAMLFLGVAPEQVASVTLYRGHVGEPEYAVHWKGRVTGSTAGGDSIRLDCESVFTSLRRPGLRAIYQKACRHALYRNRCGVVQASYQVSAAPSALSALALTVPAAALQADGWYTGGMVEAQDGSLRFVMDHVGALLTLLRPNPGLAAMVAASGYGVGYGESFGGTAVVLSPGCDRSKAICRDKFNNVPRFGGFPYIPIKNPMGGNSIF
jgi:uncharacterized phage protein (TIGR02218 family)